MNFKKGDKSYNYTNMLLHLDVSNNFRDSDPVKVYQAELVYFFLK